MLEAWTSEFDVLYAEDRMMMIGMHPQLIGQPSRLKALQGLIEHALKHSNVWIGRCDEMVEDMRARAGEGSGGGEAMTGPFTERRILVTGAAKGIGLATLVRLAAEGARVAALDRDASALEALPAPWARRSDMPPPSMSRTEPP